MYQHVLVAFGGVSPEHEVSVITAIQAASALKDSGLSLTPLYVSKSGRFLTGPQLLELESYKDLKTLEQQAVPCAFQTDALGRTVLSETRKGGLFSKPKVWPVDVVLVAFHGSEGENGAFQGLCEQYNLPYTGSGVMASSVGMDKRAAKVHAAACGVPVVEGLDFTEAEWAAGSEALLEKILALDTTVVVKPLRLGSSIGVEVVSGRDAIVRAVETGFRYDAHLLIEKAVRPLREVNCSVLGNAADAQASVCEQPKGSAELLSFQDKYMGDSGKGMASASRIIPAPIPEALTEAIQQASLRLFRELDASGVARFDFLVNDETGQFYFNEINTIPGSFSFYLWDKTGIGFPQLMKKLLDIALARHREKNGRVRSYETNLLSTKAVKGIKGLKGKG